MSEQGMAEVERICYQNELDRAEAYMNEHYRDPTAEECFERCVHASACRRVFGEVCHMTVAEGMPHALGCAEECDEYDERAGLAPAGRCSDCDHEQAGVCNLRPLMRHRTEPDAFCSDWKERNGA